MEKRLDLCDAPTARDHTEACRAFAGLRERETLYILYGCEPRSLRHHFNERFADEVLWSQRRLGDGRWEVALRRLEAVAGDDPVRDLVERCPLFAAASVTTRTALMRAAKVRRVGRRESIAHQGVDWPYLGAVRKGRVVAMAATPAGRDQLLFDVLPYDVFGDVVVADSGAAMARFATFSEPAEIVLFPRAVVLECAANDGGLALALARTCAQRSRTLADLLCAHVSKPIVARVAAVLLPHAAAASGLSPVDPASFPVLRFAQIAAAAGTVKEVVARTVAQLESQGALERARGRIAYIDRAKLARFL